MKTRLTVDDDALIAAATEAIRARYRPDRHIVGAAVRTRSGRVFTGVHLEATVGRIAVCAEAIALGRAATEAGDTDVETIVAVYHRADGAVSIVAPCGMCREMIADYAPSARVIMPGDGTAPTITAIDELIPARFARP